jgi:nitrate reductase NapA
MKRRNFLTTLGTSAAGIAAFSCTDSEEAERLAGNLASVDGDLTWTKAPCRYCGTGCGVEVGVILRHRVRC